MTVCFNCKDATSSDIPSDIPSDIEAEKAAKERKETKAAENDRKTEIKELIGLSRFLSDFIEAFEIGFQDSHPLSQSSARSA